MTMAQAFERPFLIGSLCGKRWVLWQCFPKSKIQLPHKPATIVPWGFLLKKFRGRFNVAVITTQNRHDWRSCGRFNVAWECLLDYNKFVGLSSLGKQNDTVF
jgi:hypothetical protein